MSNIAWPFTILLFLALASNFVPLVISTIRQKHYREIPYILFSNWLYWSLIHTYFWANMKGLTGVRSSWFKTPKTNGKKLPDFTTRSRFNYAVSYATLGFFLVLYGLEWYAYGWIDPYAFFWIPAMAVGTTVR